MSTVLITGHRTPVAVAAARSMREHGHRVIAADSIRGLLSGSPMAEAHYRVPSARFHPEKFADAVLGIVRKHSVDAVLPLCEDALWLSHAAESNDLLRAVLMTSSIDVLDRLHDKGRFVALLQHLNLPYPRSEVVTDHLTLWKVGAERFQSRSVVVKPVRGRFAARTEFVSHGKFAKALPTPAEPWVVQEALDGEELCATVVAHHGVIRGFVAYEPQWRSTAGRGGATRCVPLRDDDHRVVRFREIAATIVADQSVHGVVGFDAIVTEHDVVPIECNPRATLGLALLKGDCIAAMQALDGLELHVGTLPVHVALAAPYRAVANPKQVARGRSIVGGVPLARQLAVIASIGKLARRHGCGLVAASTVDLQWDGVAPSPSRQVTYPAPADAEGWGATVAAVLAESQVPNLKQPPAVLQLSDDTLPVSMPNPGGAFTVSMVSQFGEALVDEVQRLRGPVRQLLLPLAHSIHWLLDRSGIEATVGVDNAGFTTNLLGQVRVDEVQAISERLRAVHPDCAIVWRSVIGASSRHMDVFRATGMLLVPSRSIVLQPAPAAALWRRTDVRRDTRLLQSSRYSVRSIERPTESESSRIANLYAQLYVERYAGMSPRWTPEFIRSSARAGLLHFDVFEADGRMDAVIGWFVRSGMVAVPIVGYDMTVPQEVGLYRMLSALILERARQQNVWAHASSGVRAFKESRGGAACLEFMAVEVRHLSWSRQLPWRMLERMLTVVAPVVVKALHV